MSCPEWTALAAWRQGDGAAPAGWTEALAHLDGCPGCRRRVAAQDPTLLLAAAAAPAPEIGAGELRRVARTVRSLVAAERLERRPRTDRAALLAAAALGLLLAAPLGWSRLAERPTSEPPGPAATAGEPAAAPPVEEVQPPGARVYQLGTDELPVVFIFDENLDL